jgi:hypothetical protein
MLDHRWDDQATDMSEWYAAMSGMEQFLFLTGVFSTLVFTIQFALTLFGLGEGDSDADTADDGDFSFDLGDIFTLRNGISFLMGFSWGGLMALGWGLDNAFFVAVIGFTVGMALVGVNMLLLFGMSQLKHDGSIRLENAIDSPATVTLIVPAHREGVGKVRISIQGRLKEYHAVTDGAVLSRNTPVRVLDFVGSQLVVTGINE